ncbi:MAG: HDIG domain-containing protein [Firmicutes bacterium]|nr:HDIG domain-containing protein [Bacillota bacterium]
MKKKQLPLEYQEIIKQIEKHPEFQKRKEYSHHGKISVYDHSLQVSFLAYRMAKKLHVDYKSAAIGGLLHDFYDKPWQECTEKRPFFKKHGFVHASEASQNAWKYFPMYMDKKKEDIIKKHMFPLNIKPPRYIESWIVTLSDKCVSLEVLKDWKQFHRYIGFGPKKEKRK